MNKLRITISILIFFLNGYGNCTDIEIKVKIQDQIITNIDIENEKKNIYFSKPKTKKFRSIQIR